MIFYVDLSCHDIMECFPKSRYSDDKRKDNRCNERAQSKTKEVRNTKENRTQDEKSETDLCRNADPHVFSFPVERWYQSQEWESSTSRHQHEEDRVEEKGDDMGEENETRSIRTIHKRALEDFSKARIKSANDQEMEEKRSENRKESETQFFFWTDEKRVGLIGYIE